jgi:iron(III) transport system permease protein
MPVVSRLPDPAPPRIQGKSRLLGLAGWFTALVFASPLGFLLWEATGSGVGSDLLGWRVAAPLARSLALAAATSLVATVLGVALAFVITRTDLPAVRFWRVALVLPLVIPSYVAAAGWRAAFGAGGLISWVPRPSGFWGSLLVLSAVTYPYVLLPVAARLNGMPASLEEVGRLLGDGSGAVVRRVVIPQARVAIAAGSLIVFLYALSDFGAVSLMRYDTTTRAIFASRLADRELALALAVVLGFIALIVASMSRQIRHAGGRPNRVSDTRIYPLGRARAWVLTAAGSVVGLALVAPVVVFTVWWLRGTGTSGLGESLRLLVDPTLHSAAAGLTAGGLAMVMLLPAAYLVARRATGIGTVANALIASTFALPGLVLALALVYWVLQAPAPIDGLYQSFPLLIIAYVVHFGVQAHQSSISAVSALPVQYGEAARVLGATPWRRFVTVDLPLIAPGVVAGGGLVMLSTFKELPATLLLAPTGFDTLATRVWGAAEDGFLAEIGVTSLGLILMSGILTWLLVLRPSGLGGFADARSSGEATQRR